MTPTEYSPNEKSIILLPQMEKTWFYIRLFFEVEIVIIKDKKKTV